MSFDYHFLANEEYLDRFIEKPDGEQWELEIERKRKKIWGIEFEQGLMDEYRSCRNKCIFLFYRSKRMPKISVKHCILKMMIPDFFPSGNYVTLTNMRNHDIDRIIRYHLGADECIVSDDESGTSV